MATKRDFATAASGDDGTSASSSAAAGVSTSQLDAGTSRRRRIDPTLNPVQRMIKLQKKLLPLKWSRLKNHHPMLNQSIINIVKNQGVDQDIGSRVEKLIERICTHINKIFRTIKKIIDACSVVPEQRLNFLRGISEKPNFGNPMALGQLMGSYLEEPGRIHHLKPCPEGMAVKLVRECGFDINVTTDDLLNEFFDVYMSDYSPEVKEGIRGLVHGYQQQHGHPYNVEGISIADLEGAAGYAAGGGGRMQGGRTRRKNKRSKKNIKSKKNKKSKKIKRKSKSKRYSNKRKKENMQGGEFCITNSCKTRNRMEQLIKLLQDCNCEGAELLKIHNKN